MATADPQSPDILDQFPHTDYNLDQNLQNDDCVDESAQSGEDVREIRLKDNNVEKSLPKDNGNEPSLSNGDDTHYKSPTDESLDRPPNGLPNTTVRTNMPGFMFETKYVMLNFMSLIPPDLYRGHVVSTPDSLASSEVSACDLAKSNILLPSRSHSLSKSQSVDSVVHKSNPKLKHIHKLKHFQRSMDSPASDDNTNHKYMLMCDRDFSPNGALPEIPEPEDDNADWSDVVNSHSLDSVPLYASARRRNLYRMASDVSSSGDFSYVSDADDEYDSNASSIFSSRSVTCRDGFLDLRKGSPRLSTLLSESETLDETDGFPEPQGSRQHSCDLQDVPEGKIMPDEAADLQQTSGGGGGDDLIQRRRPADRSKLKLDIPCHPVQLSDILVDLQTELNSEMSDLETEYDEAVRSARASLTPPPATPLTPQTQAARMLARIGDEVRDQYEAQISAAVNRYMLQRAGTMTYQAFREVTKEIVDIALPGWRQVALLFVFGQRVVWKSIQAGHKQCEDIFDYLVQLVADEAAEFIVKQGGFGAVMNSDPSQSSDTFSSLTDADSPPCVLDYFNDQNVTQIESEEHLTDNQSKPSEADSKTDENKNDTLYPFGKSQAGDNSLAPLADIQKDRSKSFGFDVRDLDPDREQDWSLDFIDFEPTNEQDERRESNVSATNSDIFIEIDDDNRIPNIFDSEEKEEEEEEICTGVDEKDGIGDLDRDQNMISNDTELRETCVSTHRLYDRDSVYVKQDTPTPQESDVDFSTLEKSSSDSRGVGVETDVDKLVPVGASHPTETITEDRLGVNSGTDNAFSAPDVNDNRPSKHHSSHQNDVDDTDGVVQAEQDEKSEDNRSNTSSDFLSMGVKVMIASMAVLAAGVTIKVATQNR